MSNRKTLLDALLGGPATYDELVDAIQEFQGRKLKDTISDCKKIGLIKLEMDVTGLPAYRLTPAGHGWLKDNPKFVTKKASAKPDPVGDAVIEPTPHDDVLAVASSDEMPTDKACCNAAKVVATTAGAEVAALREVKDRHARDLESILSANRKFCAWVSELVGGEKYPLNLYECQGIIQGIVDSASDACDEYRNDASAAREELDGYKSLAELYGLGNTLNDLHEHIAGLKSRIATLEGNASLPLENTPETRASDIDAIHDNNAGELLRRAACHIADRAKTYDQPGGERSMSAAVTAFNAIADQSISEAEGWLLLQLLKDARQWNKKGYHADSAEDCIAYAALKAEALAKTQWGGL